MQRGFMGYFQHTEKLPPDPILELMWEFKKDPRQGKIDLSVGIYYDEHLRSHVLPSVKQAEHIVFDKEQSKTYLPIDGDAHFVEQTKKLIFGDQIVNSKKGLMYAAQAVGGTGALRVGAEFLARSLKSKIYLPAPTWENHLKVFSQAGLSCDTYPYYDFNEHSVDFARCVDFLETLSERSIILLHACCHNPTGSDFTNQQWQQLSDIFLRKKLIPFFDMAYQGFGDGLEEDAYAVRLFAQNHHEMFLAFSYSKICGLYAERVGALCFLGNSIDEVEAVASQIKVLMRSNYSNPPKHGAVIVAELLSNDKLQHLWRQELKHMQQRIVSMREALAKALITKSTKQDFSYLASKKGMFCFSSLKPQQVQLLRETQGIYMARTGRINLTGLSKNNVDLVAQAITMSI